MRNNTNERHGSFLKWVQKKYMRKSRIFNFTKKAVKNSKKCNKPIKKGLLNSQSDRIQITFCPLHYYKTMAKGKWGQGVHFLLFWTIIWSLTLEYTNFKSSATLSEVKHSNLDWIILTHPAPLNKRQKSEAKQTL